MAKSLKVTVAICTWNRCESLRRTLGQLVELSIPPQVEWELLVVNNNCTDATDAVAESFADRLPLRVLHEPIPGQSRARNLAVREARGEYLLWTDDDVLVDPNWMCALLSAFDTFKAEWVFGRSEPEWPGALPVWYSDRFRAYFALLDYGPESFVVTDFDQPFYGLNFGGTLTAHRALGEFRTEFGFKGSVGGVGEDVDMFERAYGAGMRIVYTPGALVRHLIPEARMGKTYHRRRHWVANEVYYKALPEIFSKSSWLLGVPRFLYGKALGDAAGYLRALLTRDRSAAFYYELQLLRFARLSLEAARHGFRRATFASQAAKGSSPS